MATRRSIAREDRDLKVYRLAASGLSYVQIARQVDLSKSTVARIVNAQAKLHREEDLKVARDLILHRGQMIVTSHMPTIKDPRSADIILKANDQQARLLGLYTPQQGAGTAEAASMLGQFVAGLEAKRSA